MIVTSLSVSSFIGYKVEASIVNHVQLTAH